MLGHLKKKPIDLWSFIDAKPMLGVFNIPVSTVDLLGQYNLKQKSGWYTCDNLKRCAPSEWRASGRCGTAHHRLELRCEYSECASKNSCTATVV